MDDQLTLGVEEEYQIVDAEGRLRAHIDMLMAEAEPRLGELVKPEFLQSEVDVGIPDPDLRIEIVNEARYFLPHMLALSTSSPFWLGRNTGLKSYRTMVWSRFPRTGIPVEFPSHGEWENYLQLLIKTNSIDNGKKIWWDLRPHYLYPTIEFRICDAATRVDETISIAALIQATVAKLLTLRRQNLGFRKYPPALIAENKWRAARHRGARKLIDWGQQAEIPMRDLVEEW